MKKISSYQKLKEQVEILTQQVNCNHFYVYDMIEWGYLNCIHCNHEKFDQEYLDECCELEEKMFAEEEEKLRKRNDTDYQEIKNNT